MRRGTYILSLIAGLILSGLSHAQVAKIPFKQYLGVIVIKAKVEGVGSSLNFLINSDGGTTTLDSTIASNHEIMPVDCGCAINISSSQKLSFENIEGIDSISKAEIKGNMVLRDLTGLSKTFGVRLGGVMGYDLFIRYAVAIDYSTQTLSLYEKLNIDSLKDYRSLPLKFRRHSPYVKLSLVSSSGKKYKGKASISTGSNIAFMVNEGYENRHHITYGGGTSDLILTSDYSKQIAHNVKITVPKLSLGGFDLPSLPILIEAGNVKMVRRKSDEIGSIGTGILKHFDTVIDFRSKKMYLKRNSSPLNFDCNCHNK